MPLGEFCQPLRRKVPMYGLHFSLTVIPQIALYINFNCTNLLLYVGPPCELVILFPLSLIELLKVSGNVSLCRALNFEVKFVASSNRTVRVEWTLLFKLL